MAAREEGWKPSGWLAGLGIPAPSGPRKVGCVDLMHKLEGEEDGLLLRLFYPAAADAVGQYAKWRPHKRYIKGHLDFIKIRASGLIAAITGLFSGELDDHLMILLNYIPRIRTWCFTQPCRSRGPCP